MKKLLGWIHFFTFCPGGLKARISRLPRFFRIKENQRVSQGFQKLGARGQVGLGRFWAFKTQ